MIKVNVKKTGKDSIESLKKWFDDFTKDITDTTSIWKDLTPDIKKQIDFEFSDANPNRWKAIKPATKAAKVAKGFPTTIGVATGSLKAAAGKEAKVTYKPLGVQWELNENISSGEYGKLKDMKTGDYAKYFNAERQIYVYTIAWLKKVGRTAVKEYIKESAGSAAK